MIALILVACDESAPPPEAGKPLPTDVAAPGLDARQILVRASLDVRGIRPTEEELARLEADEGELEVILDEMVLDPRLGDSVGTIFAEALRVRGPTRYDLTFPGAGEAAFAEQAVNLVRYVATTDRPFTEILTSEVTIVEPRMVDDWPGDKDPLRRVEPQPEDLPAGTAMARYTDCRPASGVIASFVFPSRFTSNVANAQRGRANALSRALLCQNYLDRPIDFPEDIPLGDSTQIENAIKNVDACQACHATLDPLASHLWGLYTVPTPDLFWGSFTEYASEMETVWMSTTGVPPGYFGAPSSNGIGALANAMANDPRFVSCSVRRVYEAFLGRPAVLADEGQLELHREVFGDSGLSMRSLVRSVLDDPAYRGRKERSTRGGDPEPVLEKLATPEVLASSLTDLTGYSFTRGGLSTVRSDAGVRAIAGASDAGADGTPSAGRVLVHRRFAEASATALVTDGTASSSRPLLAGIDLSREPRPEEVALLVLRIRSRRFAPESSEVTALVALWREVAAASGKSEEAWSALLTALLADPDVAIY
jgi:hypothetical protein